jgi:hypothetical protein
MFVGYRSRPLARKLSCHCPGNCDSVVHVAYTEAATSAYHILAATKHRSPPEFDKPMERLGAYIHLHPLQGLSLFDLPAMEQSITRQRGGHFAGGFQHSFPL